MFFFFNVPATTGIYTLSLHDALPIWDLGDGLPPISDLIQAGARLCVGVDSHACENAFEEMRAVEFDERSRLESRHAVAEASVLLDAATRAKGCMPCNKKASLRNQTNRQSATVLSNGPDNTQNEITPVSVLQRRKPST